MSGVNMDGREIRKVGRCIESYVTAQSGHFSPFVRLSVETIAKQGHAAGGRRRGKVLGVIALQDIVKGGIKERFGECVRWESKR
jgi:K+-transporting ATPase ATPase B chain